MDRYSGLCTDRYTGLCTDRYAGAWGYHGIAKDIVITDLPMIELDRTIKRTAAVLALLASTGFRDVWRHTRLNHVEADFS